MLALRLPAARFSPRRSFIELTGLPRRRDATTASIVDFHATMLHLLGLDHERLTWYHNGINRRLTDVHGHVIQEILA
jgi:hypothetical protein